MNGWALIWTWMVVLMQTAIQNLLPFPSTGLSPHPGLVQIGGNGRGDVDMILVFFPGFRLVPWLRRGNINVEHKARALVDAVADADARWVYLYWPEHDTEHANVSVDAAVRIFSTLDHLTKVIIVGESYGGVAAMRLAEQIEDMEYVFDVEVMTAASPLHGTGLAQPWLVSMIAPFYGPAISDMLQTPREYKFKRAKNFATTTDLLVWPLNTTSADGELPNYVLWGVPHGAIVLHPAFITLLTKISLGRTPLPKYQPLVSSEALAQLPRLMMNDLRDLQQARTDETCTFIDLACRTIELAAVRSEELRNGTDLIALNDEGEIIWTQNNNNMRVQFNDLWKKVWITTKHPGKKFVVKNCEWDNVDEDDRALFLAEFIIEQFSALIAVSH